MTVIYALTRMERSAKGEYSPEADLLKPLGFEIILSSFDRDFLQAPTLPDAPDLILLSVDTKDGLWPLKLLRSPNAFGGRYAQTPILCVSREVIVPGPYVELGAANAVSLPMDGQKTIERISQDRIVFMSTGIERLRNAVLSLVQAPALCTTQDKKDACAPGCGTTATA